MSMIKIWSQTRKKICEFHMIKKNKYLLMKIITIILSLIALALIIFNVTQLNFSRLFEGESIVALITIVLSLCAILLLQILRISKRIEKLSKQKPNV